MTLGVYGPTYCECGAISDPIAGQCEACFIRDNHAICACGADCPPQIGQCEHCHKQELYAEYEETMKKSIPKNPGGIALRLEFHHYISGTASNGLGVPDHIKNARIHAGYYLSVTQPMREIARDTDRLDDMGIYDEVIDLVDGVLGYEL